jgi:DNA polymerase III epsilon subunit-like protein
MGINRPFWVVDVEGNGAHPPDIVELAMVEIDGLRLTGNVRHWLIRPERPIEPLASNIHGLTDTDVEGAPAIEDVADDLLVWLDDASIVGHNVKVEVDILSRSIPDWRPRAAIDTLKLAKTLRPGLSSYGLDKLGKALGLSDEAAKRTSGSHHSAPYDATLTGLIFIYLLSNLSRANQEAALNGANILARDRTLL